MQEARELFKNPDVADPEKVEVVYREILIKYFEDFASVCFIKTVTGKQLIVYVYIACVLVKIQLQNWSEILRTFK